jgi:hypothetical protein
LGGAVHIQQVLVLVSCLLPKMDAYEFERLRLPRFEDSARTKQRGHSSGQLRSRAFDENADGNTQLVCADNLTHSKGAWKNEDEAETETIGYNNNWQSGDNHRGHSSAFQIYVDGNDDKPPVAAFQIYNDNNDGEDGNAFAPLPLPPPFDGVQRPPSNVGPNHSRSRRGNSNGVSFKVYDENANYGSSLPTIDNSPSIPPPSSKEETPQTSSASATMAGNRPFYIYHEASAQGDDPDFQAIPRNNGKQPTYSEPCYAFDEHTGAVSTKCRRNRTRGASDQTSLLLTRDTSLYEAVTVQPASAAAAARTKQHEQTQEAELSSADHCATVYSHEPDYYVVCAPPLPPAAAKKKLNLTPPGKHVKHLNSEGVKNNSHSDRKKEYNNKNHSMASSPTNISECQEEEEPEYSVIVARPFPSNIWLGAISGEQGIPQTSTRQDQIQPNLEPAYRPSTRQDQRQPNLEQADIPSERRMVRKSHFELGAQSEAGRAADFLSPTNNKYAKEFAPRIARTGREEEHEIHHRQGKTFEHHHVTSRSQKKTLTSPLWDSTRMGASADFDDLETLDQMLQSTIHLAESMAMSRSNANARTAQVSGNNAGPPKDCRDGDRLSEDRINAIRASVERDESRRWAEQVRRSEVKYCYDAKQPPFQHEQRHRAEQETSPFELLQQECIKKGEESRQEMNVGNHLHGNFKEIASFASFSAGSSQYMHMYDADPLSITSTSFQLHVDDDASSSGSSVAASISLEVSRTYLKGQFRCDSSIANKSIGDSQDRYYASSKMSHHDVKQQRGAESRISARERDVRNEHNCQQRIARDDDSRKSKMEQDKGCNTSFSWDLSTIEQSISQAKQLNVGSVVHSNNDQGSKLALDDDSRKSEMEQEKRCITSFGCDLSTIGKSISPAKQLSSVSGVHTNDDQRSNASAKWDVPSLVQTEASKGGVVQYFDETQGTVYSEDDDIVVCPSAVDDSPYYPVPKHDSDEACHGHSRRSIHNSPSRSDEQDEEDDIPMHVGIRNTKVDAQSVDNDERGSLHASDYMNTSYIDDTSFVIDARSESSLGRSRGSRFSPVIQPRTPTIYEYDCSSVRSRDSKDSTVLQILTPRQHHDEEVEDDVDTLRTDSASPTSEFGNSTLEDEMTFSNGCVPVLLSTTANTSVPTLLLPHQPG